MRSTHQSKHPSLSGWKNKEVPVKRVCTICLAEKPIEYFRLTKSCYAQSCNPCLSLKRKEHYRDRKADDAKYRF